MILTPGTRLDRTVDLVGRDVNVPFDTVSTGALEQLLGPEDVGLEERARAGDRAVDVTFRRKMDNGVRVREDVVRDVGVGDRSEHEAHARISECALNILSSSRIGQRVEQDNVVVAQTIGLVEQHLGEARTNESGRSGDHNAHRGTSVSYTNLR